jgi:poly(A) polymerase
LSFAYDDLEARIAQLAEQEELQAIRPELDGEAIMEILGISPGRDVGEAYRFMLEVRLDEGEIGVEEATQRLLAWWAGR